MFFHNFINCIGMRGAHVLIPARFMTLIGHLCVAITLLWEVKKSVGHCLPIQFHQEHFQTYHSRLAAGFAASIALILVELVTFIPGLTMFSSNVAMLSIGGHGSASIFLTYFVLDGGLLCDWFWPVFVLCSVLPSCVDITSSEHQQLTHSSEPKGGWSFYLIMAAVATTLGSSLPVGYNIGSVNMPAETIKSFCNDSFISRYDVLLDERWMDVLWSSVVSIFIVGGCTGSLLGAVLANNLGRKKATIVTSFLSLAGSVLFLFCRTANSVEMLVLGRLIVGLASGLTTTIVPMYLTELAPLSLTGTLGVVCPMGVNVGVLVAQVMGLDFLLGRPEEWPYLLSAYALLVIMCVPALLVLPESPKYLFVVKRDEDFALEELSRLRGVSEPAAGAGAEVAALRAEAEAEAGACSGDLRWSVTRVARSGRLRLPLALVCAMQAGQQTSGINAVFYYSGAIFAQAGLSADGARYATIGCGFINVCTAILMLHLLPRVGRRPLLLFSICSSVILLTALAVSMSFISALSWMPFVCMVAVLGYVLVYGFGLGPIPYFIGSEIFEVAPRPAGMAWGSLANWGGNFLVGMSFPTMKAAIGAYSFLVFAAITFALFLFIKVYFPETRGKTPLQVTEVCSRGLRSRPLQDQRSSYI